MKKRKRILIIAGFDPCGGAGVLADTKTIQKLGQESMGVITANTIQTEDCFVDVNWIDEGVIMKQLENLLDKYSFDGLKIGLVSSFEFLNLMLVKIKSVNPKIMTVWDPVLKSSSGFDFEHNLTALKNVLLNVDWVTPNWNEIKILGGETEGLVAAERLMQEANVYLKGGHNSNNIGKDYLFFKGRQISLNPKKGIYYEKHGSGCVFSSAFLTYLLQGYTPHKAGLKAKRYIEMFLKSDNGLLGKH
ncbi:bifunctional hydroxymethylpyrimidine kinase/phosphomethylpyrimidine kinase [Crocinitomix algicola]|uniref:bifunctional hydroxymethylpyrimidine kinase/phosphomethylpyrimidine kinase n=1 Tax=Crocinitomix algicola TaxID=1740263 RepID=UPI0008722CDB|nr:bifunctional hydroxymethylpyrimidine kinase/phosphomethylpyrimidine kinase [Crocinitomix algicola]